jgi:hypothetical protein
VTNMAYLESKKKKKRHAKQTRACRHERCTIGLELHPRPSDNRIRFDSLASRERESNRCASRAAKIVGLCDVLFILVPPRGIFGTPPKTLLFLLYKLLGAATINSGIVRRCTASTARCSGPPTHRHVRTGAPPISHAPPFSPRRSRILTHASKLCTHQADGEKHGSPR